MSTYAIPENVCFVPVVVAGGRKFHGRGFKVSSSASVNDFGWKHVPGGDGFCYWERNTVETETVKIWIPETGKFGYANAKFVELDASVAEVARELAFDKYVNSIIESTKSWCKSVKPQADEAEILSFTRNVIRKHHPELRSFLDNILPSPVDSRDITTEISKTVAWALTLRTRPCWMYGRHCAGGKPYSPAKYIDIIRKACTKRGLTLRPEFEAAFATEIKKAGLA